MNYNILEIKYNYGNILLTFVKVILLEGGDYIYEEDNSSHFVANSSFAYFIIFGFSKHSMLVDKKKEPAHNRFLFFVANTYMK